jgi:hypothetical protein
MAQYGLRETEAIAVASVSSLGDAETGVLMASSAILPLAPCNLYENLG